MNVKLLLLLVGTLVPTTMSTEISNQCPQGPEEYPTFYGHPDNCQDYFICNHGEPVLQTCGEGRSWSDAYSTCVGYTSQYDTCMDAIAERECPKDPTQLIPHPSACQRYYNCSDTSDRYRSFFKKYENECIYPQLFDAIEKKCVPYQNATCGEYRVAATDACDYLRNQCPVAHCIPCWVWAPDCTLLPDGTHPDPLRPTATIECKDGRFVLDSRQYNN